MSNGKAGVTGGSYEGRYNDAKYFLLWKLTKNECNNIT